jgi:hypothetical protein
MLTWAAAFAIMRFFKECASRVMSAYKKRGMTMAIMGRAIIQNLDSGASAKNLG